MTNGRHRAKTGEEPAAMPSPKPTKPRHKVSIRSSVQGDTVPWWIVSASLLVIGSSAIFAAVSTEKR